MSKIAYVSQTMALVRVLGYAYLARTPNSRAGFESYKLKNTGRAEYKLLRTRKALLPPPNYGLNFEVMGVADFTVLA